MQEEKESPANSISTNSEAKPEEKIEEKKSETKPEEKPEAKKPSTPKMENSPQKSSTSSAGSGTFPSSFRNFSKFGDSKSDGKHITLSQSDKWMKQAKVLDKKITTTDTAIIFKKQKSMKLSMDQYKTFLEDLSKNKKVNLQEVMDKMANCGTPGVSSSLNIGSRAASTVDRLTDVSKYTASHKSRFTPEGKGLGIAGRKDVVDNSGYVQGYKDKDTKK